MSVARRQGLFNRTVHRVGVARGNFSGRSGGGQGHLLYQRRKILTRKGFPFWAGCDSRLAKEIRHSVCIALRDDYDSIELRCLAKHSRDPRQVRRLLALAAVYDGMSRAEAAKVGGMDRQTLRDWAHRFNDEGADGLKNRPGAGRPRLLTDEQMGELSVIVETGPDPKIDGVVRWRRVDLKRVIEERFGVIYSERAISDLLVALSFSHISARPQHPKQDQRVIEAFKKTSPARSLPT